MQRPQYPRLTSIDDCSIRIIQKIRKTNEVVSIALPEFEAVISREELSAQHKLLWLIIAFKSANSTTLSCTISDEELAKMAGLKIEQLDAHLYTLYRLDFIHTNHEQPRRYQLRLPQATLFIFIKKVKYFINAKYAKHKETQQRFFEKRNAKYKQRLQQSIAEAGKRTPKKQYLKSILCFIWKWMCIWMRFRTTSVYTYTQRMIL